MSAEFKRIMLTLDGSELARQALPQAAAMARAFGGELILYSAIQNPDRAGSRLLMEEDLRRIEEGIERHLHAWGDRAAHALEEVAASIDLPRERIQIAVEAGNPIDAILHFAKTEHVDLIVMCTHGRTGLERGLFGSVAEQVLRHADCPVLLVRAKHS